MTKKWDINLDEVAKVTNPAHFLTNFSKSLSHGGLYHIWGRICHLCHLLPPSSTLEYTILFPPLNKNNNNNYNNNNNNNNKSNNKN